jgi:hypothetical protein
VFASASLRLSAEQSTYTVTPSAFASPPLGGGEAKLRCKQLFLGVAEADASEGHTRNTKSYTRYKLTADKFFSSRRRRTRRLSACLLVKDLMHSLSGPSRASSVTTSGMHKDSLCQLGGHRAGKRDSMHLIALKIELLLREEKVDLQAYKCIPNLVGGEAEPEAQP